MVNYRVINKMVLRIYYMKCMSKDMVIKSNSFYKIYYIHWLLIISINSHSSSYSTIFSNQSISIRIIYSSYSLEI